MKSAKYKENMEEIRLVMNALASGWKVQKNAHSKCYIFSKPHKQNTRYFSENYLEQFLEKYMEVDVV